MLSVIIPTGDCERALVRTLAMLVGASVSGHVRDVVVADAGSRDDTARIADMAGCAVLVSAAPVAARLREAATAARAAWLLFLPPGVVLDEGWVEDAERFIAETEQGRLEAAAVFRAEPRVRRGGSFAGDLIALARQALRRAPSSDQGLVISRDLYERLGGHRDGSNDPAADLLARLGRRRIVRLAARSRRPD